MLQKRSGTVKCYFQEGIYDHSNISLHYLKDFKSHEIIQKHQGYSDFYGRDWKTRFGAYQISI